MMLLVTESFLFSTSWRTELVAFFYAEYNIDYVNQPSLTSYSPDVLGLQLTEFSNAIISMIRGNVTKIVLKCLALKRTMKALFVFCSYHIHSYTYFIVIDRLSGYHLTLFHSISMFAILFDRALIFSFFH